MKQITDLNNNEITTVFNYFDKTGSKQIDW